MRFTLDQLYAFDRIVRLGSFAAAARQMNLTQPTISQRIRELEQALGQPLFLRQGTGSQLTAAGHRLLPNARYMLETSRKIADSFAHAAPLNGNLRFGSTETFAHACLVEMTARVDAIYPGINIAVCVDNSATVGRLLLDGQIDLAIISQPDFGPEIVCTPLGENEMAWFGGPQLGLSRDRLSAEAVAQHHIVLSAPPSRLYQTVLGWLAAADCSPRRLSTCNSMSLIVDMISVGRAIGVLPKSAVRSALAAGRIRMLDVAQPLPSHTAALCHDQNNASPGLREVARIVQELAEEYRLYARPA